MEDKGKGIPTEKLDQMTAVGIPGVGITGMRERVRQLGGKLEIDSSATGTKLEARLPVPETSSKDDFSSTPETRSPAAA